MAFFTLDNLKGRLSDINWKDINIKKGNDEEGRTANAKIEKNGDIILFNQYFKYESFIDNASILYHEICHLQNKDYLKNYEGIQIEAEINKPNEDLQKSIRDNIIKSLENEGGIIDEKLLQFLSEEQNFPVHLHNRNILQELKERKADIDFKEK